MKSAHTNLSVFVAYQFRRAKVSRVDREHALSQAVRKVNEALTDRGVALAVTWQPLDLDSWQMVGEQVFENINASTIFLADISELNPNVLFELGFALGRHRGLTDFAVHLLAHDSLDLRTLPSDLLGGFVTQYTDEDFQTVVASLLKGSAERIAHKLGEAEAETRWRDFWCARDVGEVDIIGSEIPEDRRPDFASYDHPNYLRYAKFADLDSLVFLHELFASKFPSLRVRDCGASESVAQHHHGILVGGASWNSRVRRLQQFLPIKFQDHPEAESDPLVVTANGRQVTFRTAMTAAGVPAADYFLIVRFCPDGKSHLLMFGGGVTHGVLGGIRTVGHVAPGPQNVQFLHQATAGANEIIVIGRVDHRDGYLNVPDFARRPPCLVLRRQDPELEFSVVLQGCSCEIHD